MPAPSKPAANGSILVVDDEADILDSIRQLIQVYLPGVKVRTAPSGTAALQLVQEQPPTIIMTDYKMPGMDGLELLRRSQQHAPQAWRILFTAFPKLEIALQAINDVQVDKFLVKPIEPDSLVSVLQSYLTTPTPSR